MSRTRPLLTSVAVLLFPVVALAQSTATPLDQLRGEIAKLSDVQCNPSTPDATRQLNQSRLERRREQVSLLLQQRIAEIKSYATGAGVPLTAEDQKDMDRALAPLQDELKHANEPFRDICKNSKPATTNRSVPIPSTQSDGVENEGLIQDQDQVVHGTIVASARLMNSPIVTNPKSDGLSGRNLGQVGQIDSKLTPARDGSDNSALPRPQPGEVADTTTANATNTATTEPMWDSSYTRAVVGTEVTAASSLATQQHYFIEFNVTAPLPGFNFAKDDKEASKRKCIDSVNAATDMFANEATLATTLSADQVAKVKTGCLGQGDDGFSKELNEKTSVSFTRGEFLSIAARARRNLQLDATPLRHRAWVWFSPRILAQPSATSDLLTKVKTANGDTNALLGTQFNQAVQDFELLAGAEYVPLKPRHWAPIGDNARFGFSLVGAAGFSTPIIATRENAQIFVLPTPVPPNLITQLQKLNIPTTTMCGQSGFPAVPPGCTSALAFVPQDRTRFFPQWFAGIRFKTYFFKGKNTVALDPCKNKDRGELCPIFPGTFDLAFGQNSAVSGGKTRGFLLHTEAFYPLPFSPSAHLFFSSWVHFDRRNMNTSPLLLDTASSSITVTSPGVQQVPLNVINRDFYEIGVGVDLVSLIKSATTSANQKKN